ncbi:hypothetical protein CLAFUW4_05341 [Fulvia fulva]|uniref:Uncharacterized protein n=1 Tax=Passalora fulva TaxID=5499 RepID=A0A9Q8LIB9_PASFU|nr:uncharacterized protein CLAFUR5_05489 [Fulvia fulva]KAK4623750.1 hypothetical protein CLAFUR4_05335 [Fulvia fulva]KAK4625979.1 hypothetical protein CLAFUR0_05343 [Fulvia fulva]UJO18171.1 hypothetical protein CLAFUR5_05489 [Fulvia fulva]WPV14699.1 hypothetical protein CLAFUW4_05341 [Fulvia fulva]WPV29498.1 hypothetical protein CLAFUW7_05339 [Fulvia fulva]
MAYFYDLETLRPHRTTPVPVRLDRRPSVRHQIHRSASSISDQHQASGLVSLSICANTPKSSTHVATCGTLCAPGVGIKYQESHRRCPANVVAVEYRLDEKCGKDF